ncbi:YqgE/AlgH family protein [bacterium]|nr:YqgE/AlgH family protein [bacterium]
MDLYPATGRVLISEPFLQDPNFARTVVLITEYSEEGTVGYVLNQKTDLEVYQLIEELPEIKSPVYQGGPVQLESFHYLHQYPEIEGAVELGQGLFWSGNFEQVKLGLNSGSLDPKKFVFFIGYSGWANGQLESELHEKAWIVGELNPMSIFEPEKDELDLWKEVMRSLGGDFALLANSPINPQFN